MSPRAAPLLVTCAHCNATTKLPESWSKISYPCPACELQAPVEPYVPSSARTPQPLPCVPDPPEWEAVRDKLRGLSDARPAPPEPKPGAGPYLLLLVIALGLGLIFAATYLGGGWTSGQ